MNFPYAKPDARECYMWDSCCNESDLILVKMWFVHTGPAHGFWVYECIKCGSTYTDAVIKPVRK